MTGRPQLSGERRRRLERAFGEQVVGLDHAKRRLVELAALRLGFGALTRPVPLLAGPDGSGRSALAQAFADGLSLPLIRIRLAGLAPRDLRGRPREDAGEPGVLRSRLGEAPSAVVLLEGVDRLGIGGREGPPRDRAALVLRSFLDPSERFIDRYAGEEVTTERAFVIATADHATAVPRILSEVLDPVRLWGYDHDEKLRIARTHLVPRALEALAVPDGAVILGEGTLERLVTHYSPEAGVRGLARRIGELCHRAAASVALGEAEVIDVAPESLEAFLGPPPPGAPRPFGEQVGVALGLVQTLQGGEVALVEALLGASARGRRAPSRRGVRSEAIESALAFLRRAHGELGIDASALDPGGVTVRALTPPRPVGATPAGLDLAVAVALASVATDRPARADTAAVGSVSLHGTVRGVPGLADMVLAAARRGIKRVLLPRPALERVSSALAPSTRAQVTLEGIDRVHDAVRRALIDIVIARRLD